MIRLLLIIVVVLAGGAWWYVTSTRLDARTTPGVVESFVLQRLQRLSLSDTDRQRQNPVPASAGVLDDGMAHFADHCAVCHGGDGGGQTPIGRGLYPKPPDMRQAATQSLTDGELFAIIERGVRFTGMPAFGTGTDEGERASWALVRFIRTLPVLDARALERMQSMTPRSPAEIRRELEEERFLNGEPE